MLSTHWFSRPRYAPLSMIFSKTYGRSPSQVLRQTW